MVWSGYFHYRTDLRKVGDWKNNPGTYRFDYGKAFSESGVVGGTTEKKKWDKKVAGAGGHRGKCGDSKDTARIVRSGDGKAIRESGSRYGENAPGNIKRASFSGGEKAGGQSAPLIRGQAG